MAGNGRLLDDDQVLRLIEEVKKRPALYSPPVEFDKREKARNWAEISEIFGLLEPTLRQKWKGLRDVFFKESKRCTHPDKYEGRWRFFHYLTFLHNTQSEDSEEISLEKFNRDNLIIPENNNDSDDCYEVPLDERGAKKRKHSEDIPDEDYDLMFLNSLLPFFKQLHPLRKLYVRNKIQDILIREIATNTLAQVQSANTADPHSNGRCSSSDQP